MHHRVKLSQHARLHRLLVLENPLCSDGRKGGLCIYLQLSLHGKQARPEMLSLWRITAALITFPPGRPGHQRQAYSYQNSMRERTSNSGGEDA